jgi:uncharacterized protein DUF397
MSDVRDVGQSSAAIPGLQQQRGSPPIWEERELMAEYWRRSSYCVGANSSCVEVAITRPAARVRDTKQSNGPVLSFGRDAWREFVWRAISLI